MLSNYATHLYIWHHVDNEKNINSFYNYSTSSEVWQDKQNTLLLLYIQQGI